MSERQASEPQGCIDPSCTEHPFCAHASRCMYRHPVRGRCVLAVGHDQEHRYDDAAAAPRGKP